MGQERDDQHLDDTDAEQRTSPAIKTAGYMAIALLLLAIILLATGAVKFGSY